MGGAGVPLDRPRAVNKHIGYRGNAGELVAEAGGHRHGGDEEEEEEEEEEGKAGSGTPPLSLSLSLSLPHSGSKVEAGASPRAQPLGFHRKEPRTRESARTL